MLVLSRHLNSATDGKDLHNFLVKQIFLICSWRFSWDTLEYLYQVGKKKKGKKTPTFFSNLCSTSKIKFDTFSWQEVLLHQQFPFMLALWWGKLPGWHYPGSCFHRGNAQQGAIPAVRSALGTWEWDRHSVFGRTKRQTCSITYSQIGDSQIWHTEPNRCEKFGHIPESGSTRGILRRCLL